MKIQVFLKISVLKNFENFGGKKTCIAGRQTCNFIKKRLQHKRLLVKFLRTHFSLDQLRWLLLRYAIVTNLLESLITCNSDDDKLI